MLLYIALAVMTALIAVFIVAWFRSPKLRRTLEEPKYRLLDDDEASCTNFPTKKL
jgi:hypothetical protein